MSGVVTINTIAANARVTPAPVLMSRDNNPRRPAAFE